MAEEPSVVDTAADRQAVEQLEARLARLNARAAAGPESEPQRIERVEALLELAWLVRFQDRGRARDIMAEALALSEALVACCPEHDQPQLRERRSLLARALRTAGLAHLGSQAPRAPLELGHRGLELYESLGDALGQAQCRDLLATVYEYLGDYATATDLAYRALEQYREVGDQRGIGWALSSIGGILSASGDRAGARARLDEALRIFDELKYPLGMGRVLGRLGTLCLSQGEPEQAREYLERGLREARQSGNSFALGTGLSLLGQVEEQVGNLERARDLYEQASHALDDEQRRTVGLKIRANLGRVLFRLGRHGCAEELLAHTLADADALDVPTIQLELHESLSRLHEERGDAAAALRHLRTSFELRERLFTDESRAALRRLEARMEVEAARKDAEIHRLRYVELEQMHAQLLETEKLALLGKLAAGISHEVNTPLGVLRSNVGTADRAIERLMDELAGEARPDRLQAIARALGSVRGTTLDAARRIEQLVAGLKRFATLDEAELQSIDVATSLNGALDLLASSLPRGVVVRREVHSVGPVRGWAGPLNQAFMTILMNALEATGKRHELEPDAERTVCVRLEGDAEAVSIMIGDSGSGIPESERARLFEVGFTDSRERVRLRLGLSAVAATMRSHGGTLAVSDNERGGTTFRLRLPRGGPVQGFMAPSAARPELAPA